MTKPKPPLKLASQRQPEAKDPLERIAAALERLAPGAVELPHYEEADAFSWHPSAGQLQSVERVNRVEMDLLKGIVLFTERAPAPDKSLVKNQKLAEATR